MSLEEKNISLDRDQVWTFTRMQITLWASKRYNWSREFTVVCVTVVYNVSQTCSEYIFHNILSGSCADNVGSLSMAVNKAHDRYWGKQGHAPCIAQAIWFPDI